MTLKARSRAEPRNGEADRMIPAMDRLLFNAVTRGWPPARIEGYIELLKVDDAESAQPSRASKRRSRSDDPRDGSATLQRRHARVAPRADRGLHRAAEGR